MTYSVSATSGKRKWIGSDDESVTSAGNVLHEKFRPAGTTLDCEELRRSRFPTYGQGEGAERAQTKKMEIARLLSWACRGELCW